MPCSPLHYHREADHTSCKLGDAIPSLPPHLIDWASFRRYSYLMILHNWLSRLRILTSTFVLHLLVACVLHACIHVFKCVCGCVCVCLNAFVWVYVCVFVSMCMYVCAIFKFFFSLFFCLLSEVVHVCIVLCVSQTMHIRFANEHPTPLSFSENYWPPIPSWTDNSLNYHLAIDDP